MKDLKGKVIAAQAVYAADDGNVDGGSRERPSVWWYDGGDHLVRALRWVFGDVHCVCLLVGCFSNGKGVGGGGHPNG